MVCLRATRVPRTGYRAGADTFVLVRRQPDFTPQGGASRWHRRPYVVRIAAVEPPYDEQRLVDALHEIDHLRIALERRTVIGEAAGIVMERYRLGPDAAMDLLRRLSQDSNRKLHDIAVELVRTSSLPVRATAAPEAAAADPPTPSSQDRTR